MTTIMRTYSRVHDTTTTITTIMFRQATVIPPPPQMYVNHLDDAHITTIVERYYHPSVQHVSHALQNGNDYVIRDLETKRENPDVGTYPYVEWDMNPNAYIFNKKYGNGSIYYTANVVGHGGTSCRKPDTDAPIV